MIRQILRGIWDFLTVVFPYVFIFALALQIILGQREIHKDILETQLLVAQEEVTQATEYLAMLQIEEALAEKDIQFAQALDKIKAEDAKKNGVLIKTIYAVDKKDKERAQGIVDGVNGLVKDVSYALQKPSYDYLKSITVKIKAMAKDADSLPIGQKGWMGTGVIIAVNQDFTYILTNHHVMGQYGDNTHNYYVEDGDIKYPIEAIKISADKDVDLALIRISGHIENKQAVVGFGEVKEQDPVYMVGMNLGRPFFYAEGTVSGFDPQSGDELVVGLPSGPGNSGSGIINKDGKLVGLLYAGSLIQQEEVTEVDIAHGLCVPIKTVRLFLAGYIE